jgi:hypothetical protein
VLDGFKGVTKDEPSPLQGAEDITDHGESAALYIGKEEGRALGLVDAALYSPNLKARVNLLGNANKFSARFQSCQALRKIVVTHLLSLLFTIDPSILIMQRSVHSL